VSRRRKGGEEKRMKGGEKRGESRRAGSLELWPWALWRGKFCINDMINEQDVR
jgi:hypothetical protein